MRSSRPPITDEEAVAAADKEMEERANRAKELLSQRYVGLKRQQVSIFFVFDFVSTFLCPVLESRTFSDEEKLMWSRYFIILQWTLKQL
jgi:hypothetical protein